MSACIGAMRGKVGPRGLFIAHIQVRGPCAIAGGGIESLYNFMSNRSSAAFVRKERAFKNPQNYTQRAHTNTHLGVSEEGLGVRLVHAAGEVLLVLAVRQHVLAPLAHHNGCAWVCLYRLRACMGERRVSGHRMDDCVPCVCVCGHGHAEYSRSVNTSGPSCPSQWLCVRLYWMHGCMGECM